MGSLMAGWDSHIPNSKEANFTRNKSLTKEDIDAFWKSKKLKEDEHLRDLSLLSPRTKKIIFEEAVEPILSKAEKDLLEMDSETSLEKMRQKNCWWTRSNSAFLNEPPVDPQAGTGQRYASQFHVADMAGSSKTHGPTSGINSS